MLAASAFNGALIDSTYNVFFKLKYDKLYDQMLATPLTTGTSPGARSPGACCAASVYSAGVPLVMARWA